MKSRKILLCLSIVGLLTGTIVSCNDNTGDNPPIDNSDPDNPNLDNPDEEFAKGPALPEGEKGVAIRYQRTDGLEEDYCLWFGKIMAAKEKNISLVILINSA